MASRESGRMRHREHRAIPLWCLVVVMLVIPFEGLIAAVRSSSAKLRCPNLRNADLSSLPQLTTFITSQLLHHTALRLSLVQRQRIWSFLRAAHRPAAQNTRQDMHDMPRGMSNGRICPKALLAFSILDWKTLKCVM